MGTANEQTMETLAEVEREIRKMERKHGENASSLGSYHELKRRRDDLEQQVRQEERENRSECERLEDEARKLEREARVHEGRWGTEDDEADAKRERARELRDRADHIEIVEQGGFDRETTQARREEFNARAKQLSGKNLPKRLKKLEQELGYTRNALLRAVRYHDL